MRISDWSSDVCASDLWAHVRRGGEFLDAQRLRITRLDQVDRARDPLRRAVDFAQLAQPAAELAGEYAVLDLAQGQRCQHGSFPGCVEQPRQPQHGRSEEHTSELQSLMRNSYAVFGFK